MQRRITIHKAGVRPILFMGGDRQMVLFSGLISGVLIFACMQLVPVVFGIALWMVSLFVLRRIAKADPLMRNVYIRHLMYQRYYPARSTPFCENRRHKISIYL